MNRSAVAIRKVLLDHTSTVMLGILFAVFGLLAPQFLALGNAVNILIQSSVLAIGAVGMTFVLLTAGIDLSIGSVMFIAAVIAGKLIVSGTSLALAFAAGIGAALIYGGLNAFLIVKLRVMAFIVTLATLYIGRGFGLFITETRAMNLPSAVVAFGSARVAGIPVPVLAATLIVIAAHLALSRTAFGRHLYAVGQDGEGARKAGLPVDRLRFVVFVLSGLCGGIAGCLAVAQVGVVSPTLGQQRELTMIAAAVLGGTSLFGGRGRILPGTVVGAILITTIEAGLNVLNVDPYLYPLVTAAIIFAAVAVDSLRNLELARRALRRIRPPASAQVSAPLR